MDRMVNKILKKQSKGVFAIFFGKDCFMANFDQFLCEIYYPLSIAECETRANMSGEEKQGQEQSVEKSMWTEEFLDIVEYWDRNMNIWRHVDGVAASSR